MLRIIDLMGMGDGFGLVWCGVWCNATGWVFWLGWLGMHGGEFFFFFFLFCLVLSLSLISAGGKKSAVVIAIWEAGLAFFLALDDGKGGFCLGVVSPRAHCWKVPVGRMHGNTELAHTHTHSLPQLLHHA